MAGFADLLLSELVQFNLRIREDAPDGFGLRLQERLSLRQLMGGHEQLGLDTAVQYLGYFATKPLFSGGNLTARFPQLLDPLLQGFEQGGIGAHGGVMSGSALATRQGQANMV